MTHLWMGDCIVRNAQQHAVEFTKLTQQSGGSYDSQGIARIGVLRADVDNLGVAFIAGFGSIYDTFSAGISFFYPLARKTGDLEEYAKANTTTHDKDSLVLFGEVEAVQGADTAALTARYLWDEFEQGVCQDKLRFLERNITIRQDEVGSKLFVGKTALYRLLGLLRQAEGDSSHIELARFAYTLARMQPEETETGKWHCYQALRSVLYDWYQSSKDRKELITAIELLIYHIRDKEAKG